MLDGPVRGPQVPWPPGLASIKAEAYSPLGQSGLCLALMLWRVACLARWLVSGSETTDWPALIPATPNLLPQHGKATTLVE